MKKRNESVTPILTLGFVIAIILLSLCVFLAIFETWLVVIGLYAIGIAIAGVLINLWERKREEREADMLFNRKATKKKLEQRVDSLIELRNIQAQKGNYDQSNYMVGLFNGLELAVAILEEREPNYKSCDEAHYPPQEELEPTETTFVIEEEMEVTIDED